MKQKPTPFITHDVVDNKWGGMGHGVQFKRKRRLHALGTDYLETSNFIS